MNRRHSLNKFLCKMLCFLIVSLLCLDFLRSSAYQLCESNNLSCSYQLWPNKSNESCQMLHFKLSSKDCQEEFPETSTRNIPKRAIIKLEPFMAYNEARTVFRITMYNISWNIFKMRFIKQKTNNCMKRKFIINGLVPRDKSLTYDCPWADSIIEDSIINFEYAYGVGNYFDGKRTFEIYVPKSENLAYYDLTDLSKLQLFTYVETTTLSKLIYKIHIAPKLNITSYEIYVNMTRSNYSETYGPFIKAANSAVFGVIDFEYETLGVPGEYVFYVRKSNCSQCKFSVSSTVVIPKIIAGSSKVLLIVIVALSLLIPILLMTFYLLKNSNFKPSILLITSPANDAHKTIGTSLEKLLREKYNIHVMMDIIDIQLTSNKVPSEWIDISFKNASHVVILLSDHKPETSVYRNMDQLLFNLMEKDPKKLSCCIEFPFSKQSGRHHLKFQVHKNFKFMKDYNSFINFIHNRSFLQKIKDKMIKNELYYNLINQIENYKLDRIFKPSFVTQNEECDDNEENDSKIPEVEQKICDRFKILPEDKNIIERCLSSIESKELNDENSDSDSEKSRDSIVLSLLDNL